MFNEIQLTAFTLLAFACCVVRKNCLMSLEQLCNFPIFPKAPDKRSLVNNVNISLSANEVDGLRLLGFLQPNVTGEYFSLLRRMDSPRFG